MPRRDGRECGRGYPAYRAGASAAARAACAGSPSRAPFAVCARGYARVRRGARRRAALHGSGRRSGCRRAACWAQTGAPNGRERPSVLVQGYGDVPRLPAARIIEYVAESPSGASGRNRRNGELVRRAKSADAACITSVPFSECCRSGRSLALYPLAGRTVSHEPAGCGPPSSRLPIVSPVPWCGPPSSPRESGSWPFASGRCCAPDEREPSKKRHAALRVSAPCERRANGWPMSFWWRRFGPWQGRVPPGAVRVWAPVAEPRLAPLHAALWTTRSQWPASRSALRACPPEHARSPRAQIHRPAWRPTYPDVCLSLRGRWLICPASVSPVLDCGHEGRLLHS